MGVLFFIVVLLGMPLDWCLKRAGLRNSLSLRTDNPTTRAMTATFRCGVVTLVAATAISILLVL